jgi:DNA-binding MarR family transcriptional regulator
MNKFPDIEKLNLLSEKYNIDDLEVMKAYFSFMMTVQKATGRIESYLSRFKTTTAQVSILLLLHLNKGVYETAGSLSQKLGLSGPTISNVLNTLSRKEFIKRVKDENDKRVVQITITEEGTSFMDSFIPQHYLKYKQLFSNFSAEELENLKILLLKLFHNWDTFF